MCYPALPPPTVVSLRRGARLEEVLGPGVTLEAFLLKAIPHVTVMEVLPSGKRAVIDGPGPVIDAFKHRWGDIFHIEPLALGTTDL